jgi:hypothetical protein
MCIVINLIDEIKTIIMWSNLHDAGKLKKKTWSEAHTNTQDVFSGGSYCSIPKKKRKKVDTMILEFLFSYRSKKKRKQYTDCLMISIK